MDALAHPSYRWRGERVMEPIKCLRSPHTSLQVERREGHGAIKCMRSPHTPATGGEEREDIEPVKWMRSPHQYRWRGERVIELIKWMRSPHTATGVEERES